MKLWRSTILLMISLYKGVNEMMKFSPLIENIKREPYGHLNCIFLLF